jgi:hypothetical protein
MSRLRVIERAATIGIPSDRHLPARRVQNGKNKRTPRQSQRGVEVSAIGGGQNQFGGIGGQGRIGQQSAGPSDFSSIEDVTVKSADEAALIVARDMDLFRGEGGYRERSRFPRLPEVHCWSIRACPGLRKAAFPSSDIQCPSKYSLG